MKLLNDMALYVEVVRARSFRGAAQAIGMPNSTLSRRIAGLEKAIGLRLLHRTTRQIEPTEAGRVYFERCKRIVDEARLAHEQLDDLLARPSGVLRVSLPADFANQFLAPLIAEFARAYPGIAFELDLSPRRVDLVAEPFDVAIRMGTPPDSNLIARPLARLAQGLYASPDYLARVGEPAHPDDLAHHECLRFLGARADEWRLTDGRETVEVKAGGRFRLNNVTAIARLAEQGLGIAVLADAIVGRLSAGHLRRVLARWQSIPVPVYALTETRLLPAKTQCFIEFLVKRLSPLR
ncbi:MAG: LysR family transcriptional regulator [Azoarcus sp.]|jgi:DNA-binding transcriptional LysR family regulator|nr:LysR family transcriptional regulator [Azoarcus sp.]